MASAKTKNAVKAHFEAAFAGDGRVRVIVLRNQEDPTPAKTEAEIDGKATLYLRFAPTREEARSVGGATIPWDETGAFLVLALVNSFSAPAALLAEEIAKTARDSIRGGTADGVVDVFSIIPGDAGPFWGGFYGETFSVEFLTQSV